MPSKADSGQQQLAAWLKKSLARVPKKANLICLEWNDGWPGVAEHRACKPASTMFSLSAFQRDGAGPFDPENPDDLDLLSEPLWECPQSCPLPKALLEGVDPYSLVSRVLKATPPLHASLATIPVAYGEHEGDLKLFRQRTLKVAGKPAQPTYFYELHVQAGANTIEDYEIGDFDESPLTDYDRLPGKLGKRVKLFLKNRPRLLDFLYFYRDWLVCSERAAELFRGATKKIQVFPAPLWNKEEKVPGYCVINPYEKLDCLAEEDILPPDYKGGPKTFDPARGYRVKLSVVRDRGVFRLNYEQFRLLVSQSFRDQLEKHKITGLSWLRRSAARVDAR